jgi:hypothetical protein
MDKSKKTKKPKFIANPTLPTRPFILKFQQYYPYVPGLQELPLVKFLLEETEYYDEKNPPGKCYQPRTECENFTFYVYVFSPFRFTSSINVLYFRSALTPKSFVSPPRSNRP